MASIIRIKRSGVTGSPTALAQGELAYSYLAGTQSNGGDRLYIGTGTETLGEAANIEVIGGKYFTEKLDHVPGTLTANSAIIVDANGKIDVINIDNITIDGSTISNSANNTNIVLSVLGSGAIDVDGAKIINLATPTAGTDAANKNYVDSELAALGAASNLDISGDSGSDSVVLASETLAFFGGTGLTSVVANNSVTFNLDDTTVVAGTYGTTTEIPVLTIDAQGRITTANTVSISTDLSIAGDSGTGTVSLLTDTLTVSGGTGITTSAANGSIVITGDDATTSTKGIASFNTNNFTVSAGAVTAKDITLGSSTLTLGSTTTAIAGITQLDVDDIRINGNSISTTVTNRDLVLDPNGTGSINVNVSKIINVVDPTSPQDAATKQYVDTIAAASLHYHDPVRVESPTNLNAAYDNGTSGVGATLTNAGTQAALVIDGVTLDLNDRVLIYQQANTAHNGVYTVTDTGSVSTNWILTRATDADSYAPSDPDSLGQGDAFFVREGATGAGELYVMNAEGAITFGSTGITFVQISSAQIYSAGDGLTLTGTEFSVNVDDSSIEIVGDTLRVKAGGITNAMLAGAFINFAANTGTTDPVFIEETLTIGADNGLTSAVSANNVLVISGVNATTSSRGVASFNSSNFAVSSGDVTIVSVDGGTY